MGGEGLVQVLGRSTLRGLEGGGGGGRRASPGSRQGGGREMGLVQVLGGSTLRGFFSPNNARLSALFNNY